PRERRFRAVHVKRDRVVDASRRPRRSSPRVRAQGVRYLGRRERIARGERGMYDYVIVGAGSAGCLLAARLSEDPDVKVLLLEAGPPDTNENIHVPLGYLQLGSTEVDWDYRSAPESECDGRRITLPRGRTLGGSSSINAMVYIRGNPLDYDGWGV